MIRPPQAVRVVRGVETIRVPGGTYLLAAGDMALLRPGVPHEEWAAPTGAIETLFLDFYRDACPPDLPLVLRGHLRVLMEMLFREHRQLTPLRDANCDTLLAATLAQIVSARTLSGDPCRRWCVRMSTSTSANQSAWRIWRLRRT